MWLGIFLKSFDLYYEEVGNGIKYRLAFFKRGQADPQLLCNVFFPLKYSSIPFLFPPANKEISLAKKHRNEFGVTILYGLVKIGFPNTNEKWVKIN